MGRVTLQVGGSVVRAISEHLSPESIREHRVLVGEQRFPPKRLVHAATGIPLREYNSHQALAALRLCGFRPVPSGAAVAGR